MPASYSFRRGSEISGFKIVARVGRGGYGAIYLATILETRADCALKVENRRQRKRALRRECAVFIHLQGCQYVPTLLHYLETDDYTFLAMECLGPSVSSVRKALPGHVFSLSTTIRIGIEVIRGLRELHSRGYLHRDVKPSNLVVRPSRRRPIAIIDLGLARQFIDPATNEPFPKRARPGFAGTTRYASTNAMKGKEQSQRDDLISLLYSLVELRTGKLPWKNAGRDKAKGLALRKRTPPDKLFRKLPQQFISLFNIVNRTGLFEVPDYDLMIAFLVQAMQENDCSFDDPYDWEGITDRHMANLSKISMRIPDDEMQPNVPVGLPEPALPDTLEMLEEEEEIGIEGGCCAPMCFMGSKKPGQN
jgi:serine/threonine protein kinase